MFLNNPIYIIDKEREFVKYVKYLLSKFTEVDLTNLTNLTPFFPFSKKKENPIPTALVNSVNSVNSTSVNTVNNQLTKLTSTRVEGVNRNYKIIKYKIQNNFPHTINTTLVMEYGILKRLSASSAQTHFLGGKHG